MQYLTRHDDEMNVYFQIFLVKMGEYLPSEVARLVLSYLLENDYSETQSTFMTDCSAIAELKSLSSDRLEYATRVDNRNLTEVLKEYKR